VHAPKTGNQGHHNIGQYGYLQEFDEHIANDFKIGNQLTKKQACSYTRYQADQNSRGQSHLATVVPCSFAIG
jgi:hypothetical protein